MSDLCFGYNGEVKTTHYLLMMGAQSKRKVLEIQIYIVNPTAMTDLKHSKNKC